MDIPWPVFLDLWFLVPEKLGHIVHVKIQWSEMMTSVDCRTDRMIMRNNKCVYAYKLVSVCISMLQGAARISPALLNYDWPVCGSVL